MKKMFLALLVCLLPSVGQAEKRDMEINGDRLVLLHGAVTPSSVRGVIRGLTKLDKDSNSPIHMVIKSGGGSVTDGFRLAAVMDALDSELVCVVDAYAYSMAAILTQWCDKTYIQEYADMMFHQASYGLRGNESLVASRYKHIMGWLLQLHKKIADRLDIPFGTYRNLIEHEWWLRADEAVRAGVVDGQVSGLKYTYELPQTSDFEWRWRSEKYPVIMMCGPTSEETDPCYGVYR